MDGQVPLVHLNHICGEEVKGHSDARFTFPITMGDHIAANGKVYEVNLTFRDANGKTFGELIPIKVKCGQAAAQPAPMQAAAQPAPA